MAALRKSAIPSAGAKLAKLSMIFRPSEAKAGTSTRREEKKRFASPAAKSVGGNVSDSSESHNILGWTSPLNLWSRKEREANKKNKNSSSSSETDADPFDYGLPNGVTT